MLLLIWLICLLPMAALAAEPFKVLVVFSYEEDYHWDVEIRSGIELAFADLAEVHYVYLDTKRDLSAGQQKAAEAYRFYTQLQPDGVIAADDNAQALFVVPYLKDRVATPVMFCGVNAEPEHYGYPAENVSGILERFHIEETLAFSRQFAPDIKSFVFMAKDSPSADLTEILLKKDSASFSAEFVGLLRPKTLQQAIALAGEARQRADLLLVDTLEGVFDETGRPLGDREVLPAVFRAFNKPTASTGAFGVKYGALSAVIKSGQEQGRTAAEMLLKAMRGTPVAELPVTRNYRGRRLINVSTMKRLGIIPKPISLRGAELLRSE